MITRMRRVIRATQGVGNLAQGSARLMTAGIKTAAERVMGGTGRARAARQAELGIEQGLKGKEQLKEAFGRRDKLNRAMEKTFFGSKRST